MKTFILNMPSRDDRLTASRRELDAFYPDIWSARVDTTGQLGLMCSMKDLMRRCLDAEWFPVLICEDDVHLLYGAQYVKQFVSDALQQMPKGWWQLYLGANIEQPGSIARINHWLGRVSHAKALHACVYSKAGLEQALKIDEIPYDDRIAEVMHPKGNSYITWPMLATQSPGYSDIRKKNVDYFFMRDRYLRGWKP